jgi:hypothetical protein
MFVVMEALAGDSIGYVAKVLVEYNKTLPDFVYPLCKFNGIELIAWDHYTEQELIDSYYKQLRGP